MRRNCPTAEGVLLAENAGFCQRDFHFTDLVKCLNPGLIWLKGISFNGAPINVGVGATRVQGAPKSLVVIQVFRR